MAISVQPSALPIRRLQIASTLPALAASESHTREHVRRRAGAMLRPPPQLTVSAWAEQHRILGSRASSEPGPWRTSNTPYLRN